jgi:signal transduction histidine kinase
MNAPCRILAVDDAITSRRILVGSLRKAGYDMLEASSGREALRIAAAQVPDLVLLDVSMPDLNGLEVCEELKRNRGLADVPVIFITGSVDARDVERAFAVGGSDYVTKPFHMGEVKARVAVHLQLRRLKCELEQSHAQLLRSQKLESIGQLAAGIAHEINTPIQFVSDNTRFLQDAFEELQQVLDAARAAVQHPPATEGAEKATAALASALKKADLDYLREEIPKSIGQSLDGVNRVSTIVRAMKEFSHPGVEDPTPIDLNRAVRSTTTVCRNEWKYVAELDLRLDPALPPVPCLPGEINQVLLNMVVNAAHAIADKPGRGEEERGRIVISTRARSDAVEIRIEDTGTGIPEEIRDRIFDPFFTTKKVGRGTGQGLAIAHDVVTQKHGGTITVDSEVGVGTTFVIRLPLTPAAIATQEQAA